MQIKNVKVELVDKISRLVLKRITTDKGECFNRILAVSNGIYSCERKRLNHGKSVFNSIFQTFHLNWDKQEGEWDFKGLKKARQHAKKNKRFFIPYKQRNEEQWNKLNWKEAEREFKTFQKKESIVPYPIPLTASLEEWIIKKKEALNLLEPHQELIAIFSSKHLNINDFPALIKEELNNSLFLGLCCYELKTSLEKTNLSLLNSINSSFKIGDKTALICYFDYPKILTRNSYVAGSFAYCCFAGDVFSEKAHFPRSMSPESAEKMMNRKLTDYYLYDIKEKKFTKSLSQKEWHGFSLTDNFMEKISVSEGLNSYDSIRWLNHFFQQRDLNLINELLISKKEIVNTIKNYTGWSVFWDTAKPTSLRSE